MTTTGPRNLGKRETNVSKESPDRSGRQTGVNQPPQQCSFPLKPSDLPSIDLRIDDNCKRRPPYPPPEPPSSGPPLPAGPAWIHVACQKFCFVVLLVVYGGLFNETHISGWERGEKPKIPGLFLGERRRMKTNDAPRLITDSLLSGKQNGPVLPLIINGLDPF